MIKRNSLISKICVMCFVTLVLISKVSASTMYVFEALPDISYLSDGYDFFPSDSDAMYIYDGILTEGQYYVSGKYLVGDDVEFCTPDPVRLVFDSDGQCFVSAYFVLKSGDTIMHSGIIESYVLVFDTYTVLVIGDTGFDLSLVPTICYTPVGFADLLTNACETVSNVVTDMFAIIISNPALTLTAGGSMTGVGVLVYKRLRRGV